MLSSITTFIVKGYYIYGGYCIHFKKYNFCGGITFMAINSFVGCDIHGCYYICGLYSSHSKTIIKHINSNMWCRNHSYHYVHIIAIMWPDRLVRNVFFLLNFYLYYSVFLSVSYYLPLSRCQLNNLYDNLKDCNIFYYYCLKCCLENLFVSLALMLNDYLYNEITGLWFLSDYQ